MGVQQDINLSEYDQILRGQGAQNTALGNWASIDNNISIHNQTGTTGAKVCLAAMVLTPQVTGLFLVDLDMYFSCDTTAKKGFAQFVTRPLAGATITSGGTKAAAGVFGGSVAPGSDAQVLTSDAAGTAASGLLVGGAALNDAASGAVSQITVFVESLTGLLTTNTVSALHLSYGGITSNATAGTTKTPFTIGTPVAFGVTFEDQTTGSEVWQFERIKWSVRELSVN